MDSIKVGLDTIFEEKLEKIGEPSLQDPLQ